MISVNLNSVIVNAAAPELPIARRLLYQMGVEAFCERRSYFELLTTDERQGYRDACASCAECEYVPASVNGGRN